MATAFCAIANINRRTFFYLRNICVAAGSLEINFQSIRIADRIVMNFCISRVAFDSPCLPDYL